MLVPFRSQAIAALLGAFVAAIGLPAQGGRFDAIRNPSLDSEHFARLFPSRVHTFVKASYDPDDRLSAPWQGNDDGFTGQNHSEAYRYDDGGTPVGVLAHFEGRAGVLGLFFRNFWSDSGGIPMMQGENNRTRIWVDGAVRHDMPLANYFRNTDDPRGQVAPFAGPFTGHRSGGHYTHAPIRWNQSLRIGLDDDAFSNASRFHRVSATLASPEGELPVADQAGWEWIARRPGMWPHHSPRVAQTTTLNLAANGGRAAVLLAGPSTLLEITCTVGSHADWAGLDAQFTFDHAAVPQVRMPLRLLGAMMAPPSSFPIQSLLLGNDGDRRITCWFPMPFAQAARLEVVNRNGAPVAVDLTVATKAGLPPAPWGYFAAAYSSGTTGTGEPFQGPQLRDCKGLLRFLMLEDVGDTTGRIGDMHLTHLEGDLCVRINGNRGSDHSFDASETSIGRWGWYLTPADQPFVSDTSFNSSVQLRLLPSGHVEGRRVMGSTFVFDPVHFVDGIEMVLEHGVQNTSNADYNLLAFFYVQPGAARQRTAEIDIGNVTAGDPRGEPAHGVQFTAWSTYTRTGTFLRDQFFGTPPITDSVRHIRDFLRFRVQRAGDNLNQGFAIGLRLDRFGGPTLQTCQADVFVDGQPAGLLHVFTHNHVFVWNEGGECEVELPRALTDGKSSFTVELRPRAGTDPLQVARVAVYEYSK